MRSFLILALVALLAAQVQADTVTIITVYPTQNCTGTPISVTNTTTAQKCEVTSDGSTMSFYSTDGTAVYTVAYVAGNTNCSSTDYAYAVVQQFPNPNTPAADACVVLGQNSYKATSQIVQPEVAYPYSSFPPSGWASSNDYLNKTGNAKVKICSGSNDIYLASTTAYRLGFCQSRTSGAGNYKTVGSASQVYCSQDGSAAGQVLFTDSACTQFASASYRTTSCDDGSVASCPSDAATYSGLGSYGFTQYANKDCTGAVVETSYFAQDVCLDSAKMHCGTSPDVTSNITVSVTLSTYTDSTHSGLCTGNPTYKVWAADSSCIEGKEYSCSVPQPSGAVSVSASLVALVFAALVALFGARL